MKRIIAVLLAVVLLSGISLSAAEEPQMPADFLQALADWAQNLNLDESDYAGSVKWINSPEYQGTVKKNQEITEIELTGLGKAQVSSRKIILDIGGRKFGIDLSKLLDKIKSYFSGEKGILKDLERFRPWLEKACKKITESTWALLEKILAEKIVLETVLNRFGSNLYAVAFREDEIELSISGMLETAPHAKFIYRRTTNGFEAEIEYLNKWERVPVISSRIEPSTLKLVRDGNSYRADLEWRLYGKNILGAAGTLDLDESGVFRKLSIDATQYDLAGIGRNRDYHLTVIPGSITYTGRTGTYELRIAENTAEKMVILLTKDDRNELGSLVLTLDEQGTFSGVLTILGIETGSIVIRPIPKEPIDEITEENVLMLSF